VITIILQSAAPDRAPWIDRCLASVAGWARARGFERRFEEDELFDRVPGWFRDATPGRPMIQSDLARLRWAREVLDEGAGRVVWLDADVLVLDPDALELPDADDAVGREIWIQREGERYRAHARVHNAILVFSPRARALSFLELASENLIRRWAAHNDGPPPPHIVGPKLLKALDNLVGFDTAPGVGSLSPHVLRDVLAGGGPALDLWREKHAGPLHAANLGASLTGGYEGVVLDEDALSSLEARRVHELLAAPDPVRPAR
jgi:hypothetical protein